MTTLLLIRHGQSCANIDGVFTGQMDVSLTAQGQAQAQKTARYLQEHYRVDRIYSSDLKRACETGAYLGRLLALPVTRCADLREIDAGDWTGRRLSDLAAEYPTAYLLWKRDMGSAACPGGESVAAVGTRVRAAIETLASAHPEQTVAVFTHATPIQVIQALLMDGSLRELQKFPSVGNASVTILYCDKGQWSFGPVGMTAHLA